MPQVQAFLDPMIFPDGLIPDDFKKRVNVAFQHVAARHLSCQAQPDMQPEWFMIVWHELKSGDAFTRPLSFMTHVQYYPDRNIAEAAYQIRQRIHILVRRMLQSMAVLPEGNQDEVLAKRAVLQESARRFSVEVEIVASPLLEYSITTPHP